MPYKDRETQREWERKRRKEFRSFINKVKTDLGGCQRCGYNKHPEICDFHHKENKNFKINRNAATRSFESIKGEINNCELLCKNCHAEEHFDDWFKR